MQIDKPLISVIVPVYNVEAYLPRCLDSSINQSYTNLEILLVDDGATDSSGKICDEYAQKDNRIHVFHKENGGQGSARNLALDNATGKYIAFVDSDDYVSKTMYEKMIKAMHEDGVDLVCCNYGMFKLDEHNEIVSKQTPNNCIHKKGVYSGVECLTFMYRGINGVTSTPCTILYGATILKNVRFPLGTKAHEDEYITHQVFYYAQKVALLPNEFYFYLQRSNSTMHTRNDRAKLDFLEAMIFNYEFIAKNNVMEILESACKGAVVRMLVSTVRGKENNQRKKGLYIRLKDLLKQDKKRIKQFSFRNKILIWGVRYCYSIFSFLFMIFVSMKKGK